MSALPRTESASLRLDYDLFELPTAQHKAGFAELLLHLRSLEQREIDGRPEIETLDRYSASIRITQHGLQVLFDDLFAASVEQVQSKTRYQGKEPLDEILVTVKRDGTEERVRARIVACANARTDPRTCSEEQDETRHLPLRIHPTRASTKPAPKSRMRLPTRRLLISKPILT